MVTAGRQARVDRALAAYKMLGISMERWVEVTGYSRDQYYKWHSQSVSTSPTTEQTLNICERLGISPAYMILGVGPMTLEQADTERHLSEMLLETRGDLRSVLDTISTLEGEVRDMKDQIKSHNTTVRKLLRRLDSLLQTLDQSTQSTSRGSSEPT